VEIGVNVDLILILKRQKLLQKLNQHVRRLPEGAPAHDALQVSVELLAGTTSVPDWRRKPGRPRSSWLRGVLRDVHLTAQEAWTAADDREGWRAQRSSVDYAL